jgi:hypothetical protein
MLQLPTLIGPAQIIIAVAILISASGGAIAKVVQAIRWGRSPGSRGPAAQLDAGLHRTPKTQKIHNQLR